jgi:hypothetical protein
MRKNQYFRFYPIKGRRIKKIRGYVRMKYKSEVSMSDSCCDNDNLIFESAYDNGPDSIIYYHIIELISLHLNSLRINHYLSYDAVSRELTIHFKNSMTKVQLDDIITTVLNLKSERKSLIDYIRRTIWIRK